MTSEDATALLRLRCLWHGACTITMTGGIWAVRRSGSPARVLTAGTAPGLRWLLRAGHGQWLRTGT